MKIINLDIMKNPINWLIIILMLVIAGAAGHYLMSLAGVEPAAKSTI